MKLLFENWRNYLLTEGMSEEEVQSIVDRVFPQILKDRSIPTQGEPKIELHTDIYERHKYLRQFSNRSFIILIHS